MAGGSWSRCSEMSMPFSVGSSRMGRNDTSSWTFPAIKSKWHQQSKKRENYTQLTHLREKILTFCFIIFGLAPHPKQKHQQQTKKKQNTVTQKKKKKKKGETASTNSIPQLILPHKLTGHSPNGTSSSSSLKLPSRMPSMTWLPLSMLTNRSFTVGSSFTATEKHWHWRL